MWKKTKKFLLDILFPKFCLNCRKEGFYLCDDCKAMLEISNFHRPISCPPLKDLYAGLSYKNPLVKNLIKLFKYEPFAKELAEPLSSLIIAHFQLIEKQPDFSDFVLLPIPLSKKRLKWRGYNQAAELAKELAEFFKIPLILDCLVKTKETAPQVELADEARKESVKNAFSIKNSELIKGRKILLIDDVYTTGATMKECARVLKNEDAKEIIGIAVAGD